MFKSKYLVKLSRVLVATFVGGLIYPISAVLTTTMLPQANAAYSATVETLASGIWVNSAYSSSQITEAERVAQGWSTTLATNSDDTYYSISPSGFSFYYFGTQYSTIYFGTNSYLSFSSGSGDLSSGPTHPAVANFAINNGDRYMIKAYTLIDGNGNLHYRYEGGDCCSATLKYVYEIVLYKATNQFDVSIGMCTSCSTTWSGVSDGVTNSYYKTFPSTMANSNTRWTTGNGPTLISSRGNTVTTNTGLTLYDTITASGGQGTTTITMDTPTTGASFNATTGVFTLTRADSATVTQTFTAKDSNNATSTLTVTFVVNALPTNSKSNSTLTTTLGRAWQETMTVAGGTAPFTFVKTSSSPQSGITIDTSTTRAAVLKVAATGVVAGTTTETITCTDAVGSVTVAVFTVRINPTLSLTNPKGYNVPATVGFPIAETITAAGGSAPISFVLSGSITSGNIYLDTSTASSGYVLLKTLGALPAGTYYETVTATDTRSATSALGMKLTVTAAAIIGGGATSTFNMNQGVETTDTLTVSNGSIPLSYSLSVSPANSGISITSSSNTQVVLKYLSTVVAGTYVLSITSTDSASATTTHTRTLTVSSPLNWTTGNSVLTATIGTAKSLQLSTSGGFSNKAFTLTQGSNSSNGITLDTSTAASGTVTLKVGNRVALGSYLETITATDSTGRKVAVLITVNVVAPVGITRNSVKLTDGYSSMQFNGSNQYMTMPASSKYQIGSTFTVEWWQYETDTSSTPAIFGFGANWNISFGTSGTKLVVNGTDLGITLTPANYKNKWTHFAIVNNAGSTNVYVDGIAMNSTSITTLPNLVSANVAATSIVCIAVKCTNPGGTTFLASSYFGGYLTNISLSKRVDYTGSSTTTANFTPSTTLKIDSQTVIALLGLNSASTFYDFGMSNDTVTAYNSPVGSFSYPNITGTLPVIMETTQSKARSYVSNQGSGGVGNISFTASPSTPGLKFSPFQGYAFYEFTESATAIDSATARVAIETMTATDENGSQTTIPFQIRINPRLAFTATSFNPVVPALVNYYDTVTAINGTGWISLSASNPQNSGIVVSGGNGAPIVINIRSTTPSGTYYETITANDSAGDSLTVVIPITVTPGLSLLAADSATSLTATSGKLNSLQINAINGSGSKTFTLSHLGTPSNFITLDTSTAVSNYVTLKVGNGGTVPAGAYSEQVTVVDSQGATTSLTISVTVNAAPTIAYGGTTSGAITLTTTAGVALTSTAFTAALGTGSRTLSLSGLNSGISIDTSTVNTAYVTAGSSLTATNSTTAKSYYETMTVTDSLTATTIRAFTVVVNPAISLSASALTLTTTSGVAISDTITATYGTGNKTFAITSSPSIAGITNTTNVANQTILTIPNTVGAGSYTITITATDSVGATSSINVTLNVNGGVTITGPSQIGTVEQVAGSTSTFNANNGSGVYTFALTPTVAGISLETKTATTFIVKWTNVLTAVNSSTPRTIYETVTATDSFGATTNFPITISVTPKVVLSGTISVTKVYGTTFTSGYTSTGTAPFTYLGSPICSSEKTTFVGDGTNGTLGVAYTVEKFGATGTCTWVVPDSVTAVSVLTVAGGGGGGGGGWAGGGGAGGVVNVPTYTVSGKQNISVVVGSGGSGGTTDTSCSNGSSPSKGSNGTNSSFNGTFTANGGGGGGGYGWSSRNGCGSGISGGSGGGSGEVDYTPTLATSNQPTYPNATSYGNSGGITSYLSGIQAGSGGGGASAAGGSTSSSSRDHVAGKGGDGVALTITGSSVTYAGGGGGATCDGTCSPAGTGGAGGAGGGGRGQAGSNSVQNGTDGLGGGGGGAQGTNGGRGGNGVVIVRYATPAVSTLDTITLTTDSSGIVSLNIPEFVAAGTYTQTITAKDSAGSSASATINITISKATPTVSLSLPGGATTATYGTPVVITATSTTRGTVTFKKGGTDITGCVGTSTTGGASTCTWTPTDTSTVTITAAFTPADTSNYNSTTSSNFVVSVLQADTLTVSFTNQTVTFSETGTAISRAFTLAGLATIDTVTSIATAITGTANDLTTVNVTGSAVMGAPGTSSVTKAGTFSLSGTGITFGGATKASYYKAIAYAPGTITVNRAGNAITLNYGASNTVTYKPTGTETATVTYKGTTTKSFSTTSSTNCTVDPTTGALTTVLAGSCDVSVTVAAGPNYLGDTITATIRIDKAPRTVTISSAATTLKYGDTTTVITLISAETTTAGISVSMGSTTGCSLDVNTGILTAISGTTTCSFTASAQEGTNYLGATSNTVNVTLSKANAPVLTLTAPANVNYSATATSATMPTPTFTITGLKLTDTLTAVSGITISYVATGTYPYNSTTVPTNANTYSLTPTSITLSSGSMSNYNTPTFSSVNWTINQINQDTLTVKSLFQEGISVPYDIQYSGGSTGGAVTGQILTGGTASLCTFVGINLRANSTGTCFIRLKMSGNQNYFDVFSDTYTVLIAKFVQGIFNFDSLAQGPGGITISSQVPVTKGPDVCTSNCQPKITGVSATSVFIGDPITLTGINFATATEVIFNLDFSVSVFQIDGGGTSITVIVPSDLDPGSGGINVRSPQGLSPMYLGVTFKASNVVG